MALDVLVEIGLLCKAQLTSKGTGEGSLACVNAQVVIEVVELSKELSTAFEVALKYLKAALGLGIQVPVDSEVLVELVGAELRVRAQLKNLSKLVGLDLTALFNLDRGYIARDLVAYFLAANHRKILGL